MFDSTAELLEQIQLGEDSFLGLMAVRLSGSGLSSPHRDAIADELSTFANAHGGVLVLGVEDKTREIAGIAIEALDNIERIVRDLCTDAIEPPLAPTIERLMLTNTASDRVAVIKVSVPRSLFVHRSPGGYLHRVGSAKRVMSTDYLARLFQQRSQTRLIRFDEQPVADAAVDDLRPDLWQRFRTTRSDVACSRTASSSIRQAAYRTPCPSRACRIGKEPSAGEREGLAPRKKAGTRRSPACSRSARSPRRPHGSTPTG